MVCQGKLKHLKTCIKEEEEMEEKKLQLKGELVVLAFMVPLSLSDAKRFR